MLYRKRAIEIHFGVPALSKAAQVVLVNKTPDSLMAMAPQITDNSIDQPFKLNPVHVNAD